MKKISNFLAIVLLILLFYLLFFNNRLSNTTLKISNLQEQVLSKDVQKNLYIDKENELNQLKKQNIEKQEKYNEVLEWNQEI